MDLSPDTIRQITQLMGATMDEKLAPLTARIGAVEQGQHAVDVNVASMQADLASLNSRTVALETGDKRKVGTASTVASSSGQWIASHVEVKQSWTEPGAAAQPKWQRPICEQMTRKLMEKLPEKPAPSRWCELLQNVSSKANRNALLHSKQRRSAVLGHGV
jgi:cell division septation protein DedD